MNIGIECDDLIGDSDLRLGFLVVVVGVLLLIGANLFAHRYLYRAVIRFALHDIDGDRAAIVIDVEGCVGGNLLAQFIAVIERAAAKEYIPTLIVSEVRVFPDIGPVQTRYLGGNEPGSDQKQHQENATDSDAS